jgi:hypothetical protein
MKNFAVFCIYGKVIAQALNYYTLIGGFSN